MSFYHIILNPHILIWRCSCIAFASIRSWSVLLEFFWALCEPVKTYPTIFLWTLLCELEHIHAGTEKGFPKNCYGKVGCIELSKMSWEADT